MNQEPKYFHEFFDIEGKPLRRDLIVQRLKDVIRSGKYEKLPQSGKSHFFSDEVVCAVAQIDGNLWQFEFSEDSWNYDEDSLGYYFSFGSVVMVQKAQKTITVYEPVERPIQAKGLEKIREFIGTRGQEFDSLERELDNTYFTVGKPESIGPFSVTLLNSHIIEAELDPGIITIKRTFNIDGFPFIMYTKENSWEHVFDIKFSRLQPARKVMVEDYEVME